MKKKKLLGKRLLSAFLSTGMVLTMMPTTLSFAADTGITIYAAAYQNADTLRETSLPATVMVGDREQAVSWAFRSSKFAVPYETVEITGTVANGDTVTAKVEVLPDAANPLVYFVDAGRDGEESKAYEAVKTLSSDTLKNAVADQVYDMGSGWGKSSSNFSLKSVGSLDATDKYQTGYYSNSKTSSLEYTLYLEAGTYTLDAGFYEWWNNRSMKINVSGDQTDSVTSGAAAVSGIGSRNKERVTFTVTEDSNVTMKIQNATGGEAPVISWFAVAKGTLVSPEYEAEKEIVIKGADVDTAARNKNGLTWKGYGVLSGNSTSDLLMDYKTESPKAYQELLETLFGGEHPLMTHVKIEMGNDGNNSTGADSCTMRFEDEEADASRSPGFQLAADAKTINPDVKVSFLRWEMPVWVQSKWNSDRTGAGYEAMYKWYKETIFDAYEKYGYVVDYVSPDKNETTSPDSGFIKWFRQRVSNESDFPSYMGADSQEAYHNIKIIASDENTSLEIVPAMKGDIDLYNAVDAIGFHYSTGTAGTTGDYRNMADKDDKEVWYSEGCATFSYTEYQENKNFEEYGAGSIGGYQSPLALADNVIASFIYSRKSHYIFQPAIGSFYEGAQYDHKELVSARDPWSGYIHYDPAIYMMEHFTKFAKTGWENEDNTAGIWRMIANASGNTSGNRGDLGHITNENGNPSYLTLAAPDKSAFSVVIVNNSAKTLPYAIKAEDMNLKAGTPAEIWETKTDSYLQYAGEADYKDGYYTVVVEPYSMVTVTTLDCNGKEEYIRRLPESGEKTVLDTNADGSALDSSDNTLYADDFAYADYDEDYLASRGNEPRYAVDFTGAFTVVDRALKQVLSTSVGQWNNNEPNTVIGDFRWMNYKAGVDAVPAADSYAGLAIRQQTGMGFEGSGYNLRITANGNWTLKKRSSTVATGKVGASGDGSYRLELEGRGCFITAWVNGKTVATYCDSTPEYFGRIRLGCGWAETSFDNVKVEKIKEYEPYALSLTDNADDVLSYEGSWKIIAGAGGGNNDWYRSTSTSSTAGDSVAFPVTGGGFALVGVNDGSAILDITVDGEPVATGAKTMSSSNHCATYLQYGLEDGTHEVTVTLKSGTLVLDAVMALPYSTLSSQDRIVGVESLYGAITEDGEANLPKTATLIKADGSTSTENVIWDISGFTGTAYATSLAAGVTETTKTPVSAAVEVIPSSEKELVYFIDASRDAGKVSLAYDLISALTGDTLRNAVADQAYDASTGWGRSSANGVFCEKSTGDVDVNDKYQTGWYSNAKTTPLEYQFYLEPGTYELTAGFCEWWNNRSMKIAVSGSNLDSSVASSAIAVSGKGDKNLGTVTFTANTAGTVTMQIQNATGGEAPVISWFAVAKLHDNKVDKTALSELIAEIESMMALIDKDHYTADSYQALEKALDYAKLVMDDESAMQADVNDAAVKLGDAWNGLVEKPVTDKTALETAIANHKEVTADGYTTESYKAFADALKAAQELLDDENATQEQINAALTALNEAFDALEKAGGTTPKPTPSPDPGDTKPDPDPNPGNTKPDPVPSPITQTTYKGGVYKILNASKKTAAVVKGTNAKATSITIPSTVKIGGVSYKVVQIGNKAFRNNTKLKKVIIGKNVTTIGKQSFYNCKKLSRIIVKGKTIKSIKTGAFKKTAGKITVTVPKKMTPKKRSSLKKQLRKAGISKNVKIK